MFFFPFRNMILFNPFRFGGGGGGGEGGGLIEQKELMLINVVNLVLVNQAEGAACRSSFSW